MNQSANLLSAAADFTIFNDISNNVKFLYCELILLANKQFWKMPLAISDRQLANFMNIDVKTVLKARDQLVEMKKIVFKTDKFSTYYYLLDDDQDEISEFKSADFRKSPTPTIKKRRNDAPNQAPKQNKTKQNKTKLTKQNDRSIARARKIENESENEYETFEVDGVINEVDISDGVVKNDTSENVNGVVNGSKGKAGGVAISDTDKFDQSSVNDDQSLVKFSQNQSNSNNSDSQTSKVEIKQITDDELRALAAFDSLIHQHSPLERDKLLALCADFGADAVIKCISETNERLKQRGDRIQSINLISTILNGGKKYERSIESVPAEDQESAERTRRRSKAAVQAALQNPQLQRMLAEYEAATANNDDKSNVDDGYSFEESG